MPVDKKSARRAFQRYVAHFLTPIHSESASVLVKCKDNYRTEGVNHKQTVDNHTMASSSSRRPHQDEDLVVHSQETTTT